jgi:hypothetical protein
MSYPYTKPTPRYGFRRRWGDPRTGIVGSGPGRPLRTYVTDAEVGLPQLGPGLTALGATEETPFNEGIFTQDSQQGLSRGVFMPDPPWAVPRYIASTPEGVSGLGGLGAFGQTPTCGIPQLVDKVISAFPTLSFSLSGAAATTAKIVGLPTSFSIGPAPEIIKPIVYALIGTAGQNLANLANQGASYIAGRLAANVSGPITQKILSSTTIPEAAKSIAASTIKKLVNDTLKSKLYSIGKMIADCAGVPSLVVAENLLLAKTTLPVLQPQSNQLLIAKTPKDLLSPEAISWALTSKATAPAPAPTKSNLPLILGAAAIAALVLTR